MRQTFTITVILLFLGYSATAQSDYVTGQNGYDTEDILTDYTSFSCFSTWEGFLFTVESDTILFDWADSDSLRAGYPLPEDYSAFSGQIKLLGNHIWSTFSVAGNTDDRIYKLYEYQNYIEHKHMATLPGNFDIDIFQSNILVSGLNSTDFATVNSIWVVDTLADDHQKLIQLSGSPGPLAVTAEDDLIYCTSNSSSQNYIFRWDSDVVSDAIAAGTLLTPENADTLTSLPAGAYGCDIDEVGNIIFSCNDFVNSNYFVGVWTEGAEADSNYQVAATAGEFLSHVAVVGNVLDNTEDNFILTNAFSRPIAKISFEGSVFTQEYHLSTNVFPNPASDYINISTTETDDIITNRIYNLNGQLEMTTSEQEININALENGIYILVSTTKNGAISSQKITIQR